MSEEEVERVDPFWEKTRESSLAREKACHFTNGIPRKKKTRSLKWKEVGQKNRGDGEKAEEWTLNPKGTEKKLLRYTQTMKVPQESLVSLKDIGRVMKEGQLEALEEEDGFLAPTLPEKGEEV